MFHYTLVVPVYQLASMNRLEDSLMLIDKIQEHVQCCYEQKTWIEFYLFSKDLIWKHLKCGVWSLLPLMEGGYTD